MKPPLVSLQQVLRGMFGQLRLFARAGVEGVVSKIHVCDRGHQASRSGHGSKCLRECKLHGWLWSVAGDVAVMGWKR